MGAMLEYASKYNRSEWTAPLLATLELILLLLAAVLASAIIEQFVPKFAAPLIQIVLGILIEVFTLETVTINFNPDFFLVLFIAPLLYDEARKADKEALMKNLKPVLGLAIGLVLITTFAIGGAVHWLIPAVPFTVACMLGAALGPTDAVAVSSLPKNIDLGECRKQVLQGEYLLNDASGIVCFQFALAATMTGAFSVGDAFLKFLVVFFGGLLVGAVVGILANAVERYIRSIGLENTTFHVLFDLFMPFIIYLTAEPFGASGIIAVVVGGLIRSFNNKSVEPVTSRLNIVSESVWQTIAFALNGVVFVLLGTQLPRATAYTLANPAIGNGDLVFWIVVITIILLGTRFLWLLGEEYLHHKAEGARLFGRDTLMSALLMTIAGPKGAVTLSIIFTIPVLISPEAFFPERSLIIFLASGVIVLTLLLSNFVLPLFAPKKNLSEEELSVKDRDVEASIEVLRHVIQGLLARQTEENAQATEQVVEEYNARIAQIKNANDLEAAEALQLRLACFDWEREFTTSSIRSGVASPVIGYRYLNRIDRRENALLHHSERLNLLNIWNEIKEQVRAAWRALRQRVSPDFKSQSEELRKLQMEAYRLLITRLKREMNGGTYPAEAASTVLMEYQRALAKLKAADEVRSGGAVAAMGAMVGTVTDTVTDVVAGAVTGADRGSAQRTLETVRLAEVEQMAISLELEAIREAYDAGALSRIGAKHLRENVTLMQVDLAGGE